MAPATAKKPRKKNAPDKPMPEWLFPDDDKNPVLNSKVKSEEQILKEKKEWDQAVNFLQHKSVSAPLKPPPPALLLTLVGAFLTSYGFDSTSRIYTTQLSSRKKLDDWKPVLGEKLPKGFPDLVKVFKDWYKEYQERVHLDESSSDETTGDDGAKASASDSSSSISSSDSSSETSSSSSDFSTRSHTAGVPLSPSKRKRSASPPAPQPAVKKTRTPFQRVPKDTKVDVKLSSNAYVSHEYGDRAHQDLSVTRGKGFTKEKNKKKRGS